MVNSISLKVFTSFSPADLGKISIQFISGFAAEGKYNRVSFLIIQ